VGTQTVPGGGLWPTFTSGSSSLFIGRPLGFCERSVGLDREEARSDGRPPVLVVTYADRCERAVRGRGLMGEVEDEVEPVLRDNRPAENLMANGFDPSIAPR
jgi:hypothetical protein